MNRVGRFCPPCPVFSRLFLGLIIISAGYNFLMPSAETSTTIYTFPEISVSAINCNSLNMSTLSSHQQTLKIYGIVQLKTDFIILSDIRLGSKKNDISIINKMFLTNPYCSYNFLHNSSSSCRGVGILIKSTLNVSVLAEARDKHENILALRVLQQGSEFVICGVYGPNTICPEFFLDINSILSRTSNLPIIVGGDWNCTPSTEPIKTNPDVLNMAKLPNIQHSQFLSQLTAKFGLTDLYRCYYPKRKDYTFIPKCKQQKNRSRIDFILVSDTLIKFSHDCDISVSTANCLFDHKSVYVNFFKKRLPAQRTAISAAILKDPIVELLVKVSAIECYIHHGLFDVVARRQLLSNVGRIRTLIRLAGPDPVLNNILDWNEHKDLHRDNLLAEISMLVDDFNLEELELRELSISHDIFLEYLVNCVRNDVASFQIFCSKSINEAKLKLISELNLLRNQDIINHHLIAEKELALNGIYDTNMKNEFEKYKYFDTINSEKVTPAFLKMLRGSANSAKLSDIYDSAGNPFESESDRVNYIVDFYKKIYTKPSTEPDDLSGCINRFLGDEIINHPVVQHSILTESEKKKLETEFSIIELDVAIKDANMNSAAGIDGLSTRFIAKFWRIFRVPLFRYATCCFRTGSLSNTFKSATIRLIPKKGDINNIKNWRPISLLSNLYKVLSRAINNRLMTTTDRITSRAQKGFTKSRYLQEVLINVIEFIGNCRASDTSAFVLSIDYAKAFDTLSINFMHECYKFFGFGEYFINMLETVGKNRTASIILDDGTYSDSFVLETGRPQGENLSPGQYNIANQIMLFRLELDPKLQSVFQHFLIPKWKFDPPGINQAENEKFSVESNRETGNTEGFADDTTALGKLTTENVSYISTILDDFSLFSGLKCNYDKTILMPVGKIVEPDSFNPGKFTVSNKITLLGMTIDAELSTLHDNFDSTILKLLKIVQFWSRLNLTLPGRIAIAKTFLVSQINHIGCFFSPTSTQIIRMQSIVDKFCLGKLNLAKSKIYLPPKKGGLGLIDLSKFLIAQHVMWFKRALQSTRDNWRFDLCRLGFGNPLTVPISDISINQHPILYGLCESFNVFRNCFSEIGNNFKSAYILNNQLFTRGDRDNRILNPAFFGGKNNMDLLKISKIKYSDCWEGENFKTRTSLNAKFLCNLSEAAFFRLRAALLYFRSKGGMTDNHDAAISIDEFFRSFKRGSKSCRKILSKKEILEYSIVESESVITFFKLISEPIPEQGEVENVASLWSLPALPNRFREFLFKYFNNRLGINSRTAHFGGDTRYCTFCLIDNSPLVDESFIHLFYNCRTVRLVQERIESSVLDIDNAEKVRWFGYPSGLLKNKFYILFFLCVQYFIWQSKLRNTLPKVDYILGEAIQLIDNLSGLNPGILSDKDNYMCILSRHWDRLRARRW